MKFKRFKKLVSEVMYGSKVESNRSKVNRLAIIFDILKARKKYGIIVEEYAIFGLSTIPEKYKKEYFTTRMCYWTCRQFNDESIELKWKSYTLLKDYFMRNIVNLNESSEDEINSFLDKNQFFFAKNDDGFGGHGVEYVDQSKYKNKDELLNYLKDKGLILMEEEIKQNDFLSKIAPKSVNTVRVVSILNDKNEIMILPCIIRFGNGTSKVDNVSSGGVYTLLDENGVVKLDGFFQDNVNLSVKQQLFKYHPYSKICPLNIQIPFFKETIEMVKEMARKIPDMKIVGWDIAITNNGPCLLELNSTPGVDMNQNYYFTKFNGKEHAGLKTPVEKHLGITMQRF